MKMMFLPKMMDSLFGKEPSQEQQAYLKELNRRRAALKEAFTPYVLDILSKEFQTDLPCFQGSAGSYDPLDAMRRDAQREVLLWVKHEIEQYNPDL